MNFSTTGLAGTTAISQHGAAVSAQDLEGLLARVEEELDALGKALIRRDAAAIDRHAGELQRCLVQALDGFSAAARRGVVPPPLRNRLARAGGQVAAQRECLARATAALDRAIDAMLPRDAAAGVYTAQGARGLSGSTGSASA